MPVSFSSLPHETDPLGFGLGRQFRPERVFNWLGLSSPDTRQISGASLYRGTGHLLDSTVQTEFASQLAEICNSVTTTLGGDQGKTLRWFNARNPMLGDVLPMDMLRIGRIDRLQKFIVGATAKSEHSDSEANPRN